MSAHTPGAEVIQYGEGVMDGRRACEVKVGDSAAIAKAEGQS